MKATEVTAGPAESNGSLLPGLWRDSLYVTCGLTACTLGSAPGPTLCNEYGKTLPLLYTLCILRRALDRTSVVDAEHERAALAVEERADVLGDGARQVRVEVAAAQLELTTARLRPDLLAANVVLQAARLAPTVVLPARPVVGVRT